MDRIESAIRLNWRDIGAIPVLETIQVNNQVWKRFPLFTPYLGYSQAVNELACVPSTASINVIEATTSAITYPPLLAQRGINVVLVSIPLYKSLCKAVLGTPLTRFKIENNDVGIRDALEHPELDSYIVYLRALHDVSKNIFMPLTTFGIDYVWYLPLKTLRLALLSQHLTVESLIDEYKNLVDIAIESIETIDYSLLSNLLGFELPLSSDGGLANLTPETAKRIGNLIGILFSELNTKASKIILRSPSDFVNSLVFGPNDNIYKYPRILGALLEGIREKYLGGLSLNKVPLEYGFVSTVHGVSIVSSHFSNTSFWVPPRRSKMADPKKAVKYYDKSELSTHPIERYIEDDGKLRLPCICPECQALSNRRLYSIGYKELRVRTRRHFFMVGYEIFHMLQEGLNRAGSITEFKKMVKERIIATYSGRPELVNIIEPNYKDYVEIY